LEFFRVALLFICQGASLLLLIAATHLEYHVAISMSTTFLNFLEKFFGSRMFPRFRPPFQAGKSYYSKEEF
jgi:hypothetical protein